MATVTGALRLAFEYAEGRCLICKRPVPPAGVAGVRLGDGSLRPVHPRCVNRRVPSGSRVTAGDVLGTRDLDGCRG